MFCSMEELEDACQRLAEVWQQILIPLEEAAKSIAEFFEELYNDPELWPKCNGIPPKKYGLSLQKKHSCKPSVPYRYIPITPKHLPYMRRTY